MNKLSLTVLGLGLNLAAGLAQSLLPLPQKAEWGKGHFRTDRPFAVEGRPAAGHCDAMLQRLFPETPAGDTRRRVLFRTDRTLPSCEGYRLRVTRDTVEITAAAPAGFRYALTTLQQLSRPEGIPCCRIADEPAFAWRGAMLDVSRHFFSIDFLKKQIDLLSYYKINRLHLHLTDAAGWRMEIKRYPRLTRMAAWRPQAVWKDWWNGDRLYAEEGQSGAYGGYYTQQELRALVAYAAQRNVTIVPEIEMPAHSEEVLTAYPELSCTHEPYRQADFCPGSVATYDFLEHVLEEVMEVFPSPYIHVGGDEAGKASWKDCPRCRQKMEEEGLQEVNELQTYLIRRIGDFLHRHDRQLIGWDEITDEGLAPGTQVMVWRDPANALSAVRLGHDVILSPAAYCYLDAYQDAPFSQPEAIGGFLPLEKVYAFEPFQGMNKTESAHVKGIQGNLWTEYVPTEAHAEYMLYPRMLAVAEIAWNGTAEKDYKDFYRRALNETEHLRRQGVNAFDLQKEIGDRKEQQQTVRHKAVGAEVTYHRPFSPYYPADGATALTDGKFGGWHHGDGRWQGFIGKNCLDLTLDLKQVQRLREISTDFLQYSGPEIYFPGEYRISVSTDGRHFQEIYSHTHDVRQEPPVDIRLFSWKGKAKARYVRITASPGAMGGWIFADEIIVR